MPEKMRTKCLLLSHNGHHGLISKIGSPLSGILGIATYICSSQFGTRLAARDAEGPVLCSRVVVVELSDASMSPMSQQAASEEAVLNVAARRDMPCVLVVNALVHLDQARFLKQTVIKDAIRLIVLAEHLDGELEAEVISEFPNATAVRYKTETAADIVARIKTLADGEVELTAISRPYATV